MIRLIFPALALVALLSCPVHAATEEAAQDTSRPPSLEQPEDEENGTSTSAPDTVGTEPAEEPGQSSGEEEGEDRSEGQDSEERGDEPAQQPAAEDSVAKPPSPEPADSEESGGEAAQDDTTDAPDPTEPPVQSRLKKSDFNGDGRVNFEDFFLFADAFNSEDLRFDLDGDGRVGFSDFFVLADFFGRSTR